MESKYAGFCSNVSRLTDSIIIFEFGSSKTITLVRFNSDYTLIEYTDLVNKRRYEKYCDDKRAEERRKVTKELNNVL